MGDESGGEVSGGGGCDARMGRWLWDGSGNDNNDYGGGGVMGGNGITSGHVCHYKHSLKGHNYVRFTMTTTVWMDLESLSRFVIRRSNFLGLLRVGMEWDSNPVCEFSVNISSPSVRDFMVEILQLSYAIRVVSVLCFEIPCIFENAIIFI